jgi:hypothetical protein
MIRQYIVIGMVISLSGITYGAPSAAVDYFHTLSRGKDSVEISIQRSPFVPARHKITTVAGQTYVDGERALGIDATGQITDEITTFEIKWNGNRVPLPVAAYAPIFNFSLRKASFFPGEPGELLAVKSSFGKAILFVFASGSGSVTQWVWLVVTANGQWYRFEGSDGQSPL